jgi:transcriptional regulator with XRE-family HTH domain
MSITIGDRVAYVREIHKLSKTDFAAKIGVAASTISRIENGSQDPSADTLIALTQYFNISSDWILLGDSDKKAIVSPIVQKDFCPLVEKLNALWCNGDEEFRIWMKVQLGRAFPEIAEAIKTDNQTEAAPENE